MIGWILLAVLALLILLLFCLRLGVAAGYDQTGGWLMWRLGPKWFSLYPPSPKKKTRPVKEKPAAAPKEKPALGGALDLALALLPDLKQAAGRFRRALRIDELTLHLVWGEDDPADAAIHYGRAWAVVEGLLAFLEANFIVKKRQVRLDLDYQLEHPRLTVRAGLSLTVFQLLRVALPLGWAALKTMWEQRKGSAAASPAGSTQEGETNHGKESSCQ